MHVAYPSLQRKRYSTRYHAMSSESHVSLAIQNPRDESRGKSTHVETRREGYISQSPETQHWEAKKIEVGLQKPGSLEIRNCGVKTDDKQGAIRDDIHDEIHDKVDSVHEFFFPPHLLFLGPLVEEPEEYRVLHRDAL
eukprot:1139804-Amorphochlora_amoeboformis.AAC.2